MHRFFIGMNEEDSAIKQKQQKKEGDLMLYITNEQRILSMDERMYLWIFYIKKCSAVHAAKMENFEIA